MSLGGFTPSSLITNFADQAVVLRHGLVGWQGAAADAGDELLAEYLGGETASTI